MKASDIVPQGIKVTFEFASVEQAIAWLGTKIMAGASAQTVQGSPARPAPTADAPASRQRKGRADKGKPRGPHKNAAAPQEEHTKAEGTPSAIGHHPAVAAPIAAPPIVATPEAGATAPSVASTAESPASAGAAPSATKEEVLALFERIFNEKGMQVGRDLLSRYGVKRVPDLKKEMYGEFAEHAKKVLEGGAV